MKITSDQSKRYQAVVNETMPKSNVLAQVRKAFLVGGIICCIGEGINKIGVLLLDMDEKTISGFVSVVMIFLGALLTGIGVYDKIGNFAGAGSIVPITGFANSTVAPAMEHQGAGFVLGVAAQLFSLAGPVLVYGTIASIVVGVIAFFVR